MTLINEVKISFPSRSTNEHFSRVAISAFISHLDPTVEQLSDIKTAVSEAVTNAIVHGYKNKIGIIYMHAKLYEDSILKITIRDKGVGIDDIKQAMQPMFTTEKNDERAGLGFSVMQMFCDKVSVRSAAQKGTTVTLVKNFKSKSSDSYE